MSLAGYEVRTSIAVSDMGPAVDFYERKLGLAPERVQADESRIYSCGGGTSLHVYGSPAHAGTASATLATWYVDDLERVVDELTANGVSFEHYDEPALRTDEKGIALTPDGRVAWFRDPDGNTFAIEQ
jgi:catechol 2,3-dioxygenase-like lactoylglutathione lyase family enzyme